MWINRWSELKKRDGTRVPNCARATCENRDTTSRCNGSEPYVSDTLISAGLIGWPIWWVNNGPVGGFMPVGPWLLQNSRAFSRTWKKQHPSDRPYDLFSRDRSTLMDETMIGIRGSDSLKNKVLLLAPITTPVSSKTREFCFGRIGHRNCIVEKCLGRKSDCGDTENNCRYARW